MNDHDGWRRFYVDDDSCCSAMELWYNTKHKRNAFVMFERDKWGSFKKKKKEEKKFACEHNNNTRTQHTVKQTLLL